jgi:hypothetical protein
VERLAKGCQTAADCAEVAAQMPSDSQLIASLALIALALAASVVVLWRSPREWSDNRGILWAAVPVLVGLPSALIVLAQ